MAHFVLLNLLIHYLDSIVTLVAINIHTGVVCTRSGYIFQTSSEVSSISHATTTAQPSRSIWLPKFSLFLGCLITNLSLPGVEYEGEAVVRCQIVI